jgi:oxygen-independent coproporphyrinogen-3 oxidase
MNSNPQFDAGLLRRYDQSGPRYTSYPTAAQFSNDFSPADYRALAQQSNELPIPAPLSLYVHIPFCATVCYYCACTKIITRNRSHAAEYLRRLKREIALQGALFDPDRKVVQMHWGGGTPTFLSPAQMQTLMEALRTHFVFLPDAEGEYALELDPRTLAAKDMALLRELGFNRLSLGVQDLDPAVQRAVNRVQSSAETADIIAAARALGFRSCSLDLIYGLPQQTLASFAATLDTVVALNPDRISVFNYAHLPERFKTQRQIDSTALPSAATKLAILQHTIARLTDAGYVYIGMDHFAKPEDDLARAQQQGLLGRNFQGYTTHSHCDLVGLGMSAISQIGAGYAQNTHRLDAYYQALDNGQLAIQRGLLLSKEDLLRRSLILRLICDFELDIAHFEAEQGIQFAQHFQAAYPRLQALARDGLLTLDAQRLRVTATGRLLIRTICMAFDAYLQPDQRGFSRLI